VTAEEAVRGLGAAGQRQRENDTVHARLLVKAENEPSQNGETQRFARNSASLAQSVLQTLRTPDAGVREVWVI
jgi:hypothetical protein